MSKGAGFLLDSNMQREREEYLESLISSDKAIIAFQEEGNLGKVAETYSARSITFIHLHLKTKDRLYLVLAKSAASTAVDIARLSKNQSDLVIPLLGLGRVHSKLEEYSEASKYYQEALDHVLTNPPASHDRPSVVADIKIHLAASQYKTGDRSAIERLKEALSDLEKADEDSYTKNVWVSGGYMRLAELLVKDNPEESKKYLAKAKEIIDSDKRLTIRLKQWTELSQKLK